MKREEIEKIIDYLNSKENTFIDNIIINNKNYTLKDIDISNSDNNRFVYIELMYEKEREQQ